jgi:hypothetical protein
VRTHKACAMEPTHLRGARHVERHTRPRAVSGPVRSITNRRIRNDMFLPGSVSRALEAFPR